MKISGFTVVSIQEVTNCQQYFQGFSLSVLKQPQNLDPSLQDLHRLEKYVDIEGFLEKSLEVKFALKSVGNHSKALIIT